MLAIVTPPVNNGNVLKEPHIREPLYPLAVFPLSNVHATACILGFPALFPHAATLAGVKFTLVA
jgi:hypothetical protein